MTKDKSFYPPLFSAYDYYSKKDLGFPIILSERSISSPTTLKHYTGITFIYFKNDGGEISVNSIKYPIKRGMLVCLASYHYFRILPGSSCLNIIKCNISYGTFLYMVANPYYYFSEITHSSKPLTSYLSGDMRIKTENLLTELLEVNIKHDKKAGETEFLLAMRLLGIFQHTYSKD